MKYLASYLLLGLAGNEDIDASAVKSVLSSVGISSEDEKLNKVLSELKGKNIEELIAAGAKKLATVPSGGAAPAGGAAASSGPAAGAGAKEEKKEEVKEESEDEDMGFGLFD